MTVGQLSAGGPAGRHDNTRLTFVGSPGTTSNGTLVLLQDVPALVITVSSRTSPFPAGTTRLSENAAVGIPEVFGPLENDDSNGRPNDIARRDDVPSIWKGDSDGGPGVGPD